MYTEDEDRDYEAALIRDRLTEHLGDRFRLGSRIGRGSSAIVFAADELRYERRVALKVLAGEGQCSLNEQRFQREIRLLARLQHPNILPLYDSGNASGLSYYVTPLVDGGTLRERLRRGEPLTVAAATRIAINVAEALDYAHRRSIVHRDVKPENILLTSDRAFLADFGVALPAGGRTLTLTGIGSPGTPLYMSPEQPIPDIVLDGRSDMYSLALVLYESLAGMLPYQNAQGVLPYAWRYSVDPPSITSVRGDVPDRIARAIARALRREPHERFADVAEFVAEIRVGQAELR
jgi:serine/threonine-protein kinase